MVTGPEGRRRAVTRAASASVGNGNASFSGPHVAVGNLRVSQTECPPGYATRITNIAKPPPVSQRWIPPLRWAGFRRSALTHWRRRKLPSQAPCRARLAHYGLVGVSGATAGTPSGLMCEARDGRG